FGNADALRGDALTQQVDDHVVTDLLAKLRPFHAFPTDLRGERLKCQVALARDTRQRFIERGVVNTNAGACGHVELQLFLDPAIEYLLLEYFDWRNALLFGARSGRYLGGAWWQFGLRDDAVVDRGNNTVEDFEFAGERQRGKRDGKHAEYSVGQLSR